MNPTELALMALVAIVCGTIAQLTSSTSKGGWILHPVIGFFGALAGVLVSRSLNAPLVYDLKVGGIAFPVIYSIIGAVFFLAGIGFLIKPRRR